MDNKHRFILWSVVLVAAVTLLPFLGTTEFATKGEPREAVVAVSMLNQHDWVLPVNNGVDIPYKPPFFQWCIALFSLPAGHVTEFTSRLPSALALIVMLAMGAVFFAKRKGQDLGFLAAMLTLTAFEVHRAATNCRVDMVLTMFIVCALYAFYRWWEARCRRLPWLAILCMSGATLTKGPVGIVLPCLVMFVFVIIRRSNYKADSLPFGEGRDEASKLKAQILRLVLSALLACVLPLLWYVAAWRQGGREFLDLVMDENAGRFLGKMKFVTHDNPWTYNVLMLVSGCLPWTLPLLLSLFVLPWRRWAQRWRAAWQGLAPKGGFSRITALPARCVAAIRKADSVQVFTWLAFLLIFFFYCIPKSKRGVYLLPCYPFMAVLIVEYAVWLMKRSSLPIRLYIGFLSVAGILLTAALVAVRAGAVRDIIFRGRHAYENAKVLHALADGSLGAGDIVLVVLPLCAACLGLMVLLHRRAGFMTGRPVLASAVMTLLVFMAFDGYYKPAVMNTKSYRPFAMTVDALTRVPGGTVRPLYAFTGFSQPGSDPLRFFGVDFYLGDRVRQFDKDKPARGLLMVNADNNAALHNAFDRDYWFKEVMRSAHRETEFKDTVYVYEFARR